MSDLVVAVDVGTGSARAGVLDRAGRLLGRAEHPIRINRPQPEQAEQSTTDIWQAVGRAVRGALAEAAADRAAVKGISVDATCSLVVLDRAGRPVTVSHPHPP
jgi:ribulose kinase